MLDLKKIFLSIQSDQDIELLVDEVLSSTVPKAAPTDDPIWEQAQATLLRALIAYLYHNRPEEDQTIDNVMRLLRAEVLKVDAPVKSPLDHLYDEVRAHSGDGRPLPYEVVQYDEYCSLPDRVRSDASIMLGSRLSGLLGNI